MRNTRFAIHYMNTSDSEVIYNDSRDNSMGYAIMFSDRLRVTGNRSENDRDYGFLFNSANRSVLTGNTVIGHPASPDRWRDMGQSSEEGVPVAEPVSPGADPRSTPRSTTAAGDRFQRNRTHRLDDPIYPRSWL